MGVAVIFIIIIIAIDIMIGISMLILFQHQHHDYRHNCCYFCHQERVCWLWGRSVALWYIVIAIMVVVILVTRSGFGGIVAVARSVMTRGGYGRAHSQVSSSR